MVFTQPLRPESRVLDYLRRTTERPFTPGVLGVTAQPHAGRANTSRVGTSRVQTRHTTFGSGLIQSVLTLLAILGAVTITALLVQWLADRLSRRESLQH